MSTNISLGQQGEDIACKYLRDRGYQIIDRNWRCKKLGELDIVTLKDNVLIFVEVKTRSDKSFGEPVESVRPWKLAHIKRVAWAYKKAHPNLPGAMKIEVVGILIRDGNVEVKLYRIY